ncbi:MAG: phosphoenolpyruvate--protein phosphotransferase [Deltaproteobacteria bacterium]|nr:phosphoenolpyruvate--protein phosphotransferase [Deltaproteobacteria bacterium]
MKALRGIAVSPGIIIGKARIIDRSRVKILYQYLIDEKQVHKEVERLKDALRATQEQIVTLKNRMPEQIKQHAFILDSHVMMIQDGMLSDSTINTILQEKINAEWALKKSIQNIGLLFDQVEDEYIRERFHDVENLGEKILRNLAGKEQESLQEIDERVIIVAHDLSPVDTSEMNIAKVMGFITDVGGRTSHTAIMAQSLKIPAVVGLESVTHQVRDGTLLIVDGNRGEVIIDPDDDAIIRYQEKQLEHQRYESSIVKIGRLPAETMDGHKITIKANIEFLEEVVAAKDYGAEGIGLYRTEFLYLRGQEFPREEELFEDYKQMAEIMAPTAVTIRTLDLGGDKFSSKLALDREMNPALGLRAIRFCLKQPEIFKTQLRAILRASAFGEIRLLIPMISGLQEILDTKEILEAVMAGLQKEGLAYDADIKTGIMIEIPSAVAVADILARHVDFFSIGTNDLIQYALAIDRVNENVAFMYEPFHPAILRMIQQVVKAAKNAGIGIALCGEMAGDPLCVFILLAFGIDELSMNAGNIPLIKKAIRSVNMEEVRADLEHIFQLDTAQRVRAFITERVKQLVPDLDKRAFALEAPNSISDSG